MDKSETLTKIKQLGLLAVLRGPTAELALQMVDALVSGGVTGIEITYSTPNAVQVVETLYAKYKERILLGMGTLTESHQPAEALAAGARFIVSPHFDPELARKMAETGLVVMLGALTPTEVYQAHRAGSDIVKIFPGSLVGPAYLKSLHGPYPYIQMMPTGGVNAENIKDWFAASAVAVGAGSELCSAELAKKGWFDEIERRAVTFSRAVTEARSAA